MMLGIWTHLREVVWVVLNRLAFTVVPGAYFSLLVITVLSSMHDLPPDKTWFGLGVLAYVAGGLTGATTAFGSYITIVTLLDDMKKNGVLQEVLGAPLGGIILALIWLSVSTIFGLLGGVAVLGFSSSLNYVSPNFQSLLPLACLAAIFSGFGLTSWLVVPGRWLGGFKLYIMPMLGVFGATTSAWGESGKFLAWANPVHHCGVVVRAYWSGTPEYGLHHQWSLAILVVLAFGFWVFSCDLCRQGVGIRSD